ncbi:MAG: hypothetical protein APF84_11785 [Gracilibacter sp. BRH_c7a]|nr:MAG: hypothetical protein APF84_11785 [Gracilibacter sp. BRH_c7a]
MASYATLQKMDNLKGKERESGIFVNDRFISYFQVESVLYSFSKVLEAGVIVQSHKEDNEKLKIYLALEESFNSDEERESYCQEVEEFVGRKFSLKMPINVLVRDKLPMTRSGKILRSVLIDY